MSDLSAYRPNVGVIVFDRQGRVWLGHRAGEEGPYCWQYPQGGVDEGEDLADAALRELHEETGMSSVEFLARTPVSYTIGLAGFEGSELTRTLGNTQSGLPFTVAFNRQGAVSHRKAGATTLEELSGWARGA